MPKRTKNYDDSLLEALRDPKEAVAYLVASFNQPDAPDAEQIFLMAVRDVAIAQGVMVSPRWTFDRPTEPGEYWLSIATEKRPAPARPEVVFPAVTTFILYGGGQGCYREGGSMLDLEDPWFDGAQWAKRETPADPFTP